MATLDKQIGSIRKAVSSPTLTPRVAMPGGELEVALTAFADAVKTMRFSLDGRMPMGPLRATLDEQIKATIDRLPGHQRIRDILNLEVPFGVSTAANLVEVVPGVIHRSGVNLDPRGVVEGSIIPKAANRIGLCAGQTAPTIRRELTRYRDPEGVDWVRSGGIGNEKHDRYALENFVITGLGDLRMTDVTYGRVLEEVQRYAGIEYGGCPAIRFLMDAGYGNLLNGLVQVVRRTCLDHFDFKAAEDPLVRRDTTEQQVFPDLPVANVDLYR